MAQTTTRFAEEMRAIGKRQAFQQAVEEVQKALWDDETNRVICMQTLEAKLRQLAEEA